MTTLCGKYCDKFADATHGMPQGISLNAPYKFHWVDVVKVDGNTVHCKGAGDPMEFTIKQEKNGREYFDIVIPDPIFGPQRFRAIPFKNEL